MFFRPTVQRFFVALLSILVCAGCGDSATPKAKGSTSANNTANNAANNSTNGSTNNAINNGNMVVIGEVTAVATVAKEVAEVAGTGPQSGNTLLLVEVAIGNGLETALPVGYVQFRLRTGDNLERAASALSASTVPACPVDALQSANSVLSCVLAFEVPRGTVPSTLIFEAPDGTVESALRLEKCTECDGRCVDLKTDNDHCGKCSTDAPFGSSCVDGAYSCGQGSYVCRGECQSNSYGCDIDSTTVQSCASICTAAGLGCKSANYFFTCGDNGVSDRNAACSAVPPSNCRDYYTNCECGP